MDTYFRTDDAHEPKSRNTDPAVLDTAQAWAEFSRPVANQQGWYESFIMVQKMHCAACATTVENAVSKVVGVDSVQVNGASFRAKVVWDAKQTVPSAWMKAIEQAGYIGVPAQDTFAREHRLMQSRVALWRWLVAGFCMMQVMMYATTEYFANAQELTMEARQLMRWASWVLTLPVVLFSCKPFFVSALRDIRHRTVSMDLPVALGMLITFVVSSLGTFEPQGLFGEEVYFDSLTMFVFFLLTGRWLELRLRDKTTGALEALINRMPDSVERQDANGDFKRISAAMVEVGDVLRIWVGESFPADGIIVQGSTQVDEALLTGESRPVQKHVDCAVIAGSFNLDAQVLMQVQVVGKETRFAKIVQLMEQAATEKPQLTVLADKIARPFLWGVLLIAGAVAVWGWSSGANHAVMAAVAVLIVTCPCALSLASPAAMLAAAGNLAKQGVYLRHLHSLETLSRVTDVVFDKTGTLTDSGIKLIGVTSREGVTHEQAVHIAAWVSQQSLHPVSKALAAQTKLGVYSANFNAAVLYEPSPQYQEIAGQGVRVRGQLLGTTSQPIYHTYHLGNAAFCACEPLTTDAVQTHLSDDQGWVASFEFEELIRGDALTTVIALKNMGLNLHIVSGDATQAVGHLAQRLSIDQYHSHCSPQQKLDIVKQMQQAGRTVAMVGDGINDAPVLAGSHVSFAFGQALPITQSKSDVLVLGTSLSCITTTVEIARLSMRVVKQNLLWALLYNLLAIPFAAAGLMPAWLAGIGMAVSSLLVVGNAMRLLQTTQHNKRG